MDQANLDRLCWDCDGYKGCFMDAKDGPLAGLPIWHKCPGCNGTGLRCDQIVRQAA